MHVYGQILGETLWGKYTVIVGLGVIKIYYYCIGLVRSASQEMDVRTVTATQTRLTIYPSMDSGIQSNRVLYDNTWQDNTESVLETPYGQLGIVAPAGGI